MKLKTIEDLDCENPSPGLYDVPFETYCAIKAHNSGIVRAGQTALHYQAKVDGSLEKADTSHMRIGRASHCYILEGSEEFFKRFVVTDGCVAELKSGQRKGEQCGNPASYVDEDGGTYCGQHGRSFEKMSEWVTSEELAVLQSKYNSIRRAPITRQLKRPGYSEMTFVWEQWGQLWKGRADRVSLGELPIIIDLKDCQVGDGFLEEMNQPVKLQRKIRRYEYHVQAAMYRDAVKNLTGQDATFIWLFVESSEPYDVVPIALDAASYEIGKETWRQRFFRWRDAVAAGTLWGTVDENYPLQRISALPKYDLAQWQGFEPDEPEAQEVNYADDYGID